MWSVGLITVEKGGGKVRVRAQHIGQIVETSVKVTSVTWPGTPYRRRCGFAVASSIIRRWGY
jgi:hypothetical protein